jgi:hypothetical protein
MSWLWISFSRQHSARLITQRDSEPALHSRKNEVPPESQLWLDFNANERRFDELPSAAPVAA